MKKIIYFLFSIILIYSCTPKEPETAQRLSQDAAAVVNSPKAGRIFTNCGTPTSIPAGFDKTKDYVIDSCNHITYAYTTTWTVSTILNGPKGDKGDAGTGGGGGVPGLISPDNFGARHNTNTISTADLPQYASIGAKTTDTYDWAALQMAMNASANKIIYMYGTYFNSRGIDYKANPSFGLLSQNCYWQTTNNNSLDMLYRSDDISTRAKVEALAGTLAGSIKGVNMIVGSNQNGINATCLSNLVIEQCNTQGGKTGFIINFCMKARVLNCQAQNSINGFYSGTALPGDVEPTSNYILFENCETHTVSNIAFNIDEPYGARLDGIIVEGNGACNYGVVFNGKLKNTNKLFYFSRLHFEQTGGCNNAIMQMNLRDQTAIIDGFMTHYKGLFVEGNADAGQASIVFTHCNCYLGDNTLGDVNHKYFASNGCSWLFDSNRAFNFKDLQPYFRTTITMNDGWTSWANTVTVRPF